MDKKKTTKVAALLISIMVLCLTFQNISDWSAVGIHIGCGFKQRLLYSFCHVNLIHAMLNAWCMLSIVFIYDIKIFRFLYAYIIAAAVPSFCLSEIPTVGLSGVVFVLFGSISFEVGKKAYYQLWMLAYLIAGFFFPNTNAWIHIYCYLAGCVLALFNKPIKIG